MTLSPSVQSRRDELVTQGREALLAGDKQQAQALLNRAVELDPCSEEAWIWLSGTHADPEAMEYCLQQVLALNPHNQQAQDGLQWLAQTHGVGVAHSKDMPDAVPIQPAIAFHAPSDERTIGVLLEAALHPFAVGSLLGLLRLVSWLRPTTLVLLRTDAGPLGLSSSAGVALITALTHGAGLLLVWLWMGFQLSRLRVKGRGDRFDSLVRLGQVWIPGYLWVGALLVAIAGLGLGPGPWRVIVGLCSILLVIGAALIIGRLWRLLDRLAVPYGRRGTNRAWLVFTLLVGALLGLGLAGVVSAAVLG